MFFLFRFRRAFGSRIADPKIPRIRLSSKSESMAESLAVRFFCVSSRCSSARLEFIIITRMVVQSSEP
jgi:hypothetical protein